MMKWSWAWKEAIVAYFKVLCRHFHENELQYIMKITQYNRPPDRLEPSNTECLQLDHDVRYFSTEYAFQ